MKYKIALLAFLGIILIAPSIATAITISPQIVEISGRPGTFHIRTISLENRANAPVNVTIEVSPLIGNYYLPKTHYTLEPYEQRDIQFGVTINKTVTATITYFYNDDYLTQIIRINATKIEPTILMSPTSPSPGQGAYVMLISKKLINAQGIVICSETDNTYPFTITMGIGSFKLDDAEKPGSAVMRIIGDDIDPIFYSFNISGKNGASPSAPKMTIDGLPDEISHSTSKIVTLMVDGKAVQGTFIITKPDSNQVLKTTDGKGRISIDFDTGGLWNIYAENDDYNVSKAVKVKKESMNIDFPSDIKIGVENTITVSPGATCEFTGPDGTTVMVADSNGKVKWIPESPGEYTIEAYTDGDSGRENVVVWQYASIKVRQYGVITASLEKGVAATVDVVDTRGMSIEGVDKVTIENPNGFPVTASLTKGQLQWTPSYSGVYTISVADDEDNFIVGGSHNVMVSGGTSTSGFFDMEIIVIILAGVLIVAVIVISRKRAMSTSESPSGRAKVGTGSSLSKLKDGLKGMFRRESGPPFYK